MTSPLPLRQLPEPARFWIVYRPRLWPAAPGPWSDLGRAQLEALPTSPPAAPPAIDLAAIDDLCYLPPLASEFADQRTALLEALPAGMTALVQLNPGETAPPGVMAVYDLLPPLLTGDLSPLATLPAGALTVWPLVAGISNEAQWEEGLGLLAAAGVHTVQPLSLELTPAAQRALVETMGEGYFDALFHGAQPSERDFARRAHRHGLVTQVARPEVSRTPRYAANRFLATQLALAGELWLRLDRAVNVGQAYFRAARGAEETPHDIAALVREGNLRHLPWVDEASATLIEDLVATGAGSVEALQADYLASP